MELAHSLLLNEDALKRISDSKRPVFVFEWLRFLDKVLVAAQKSDIKESQKKLIHQLTSQIKENPGPPTRKLLARCLATIFSVGDTFALFETINICNDIIRNKDDSPSYLPTRLAAVACIGGMYEKLGRMVGRSYEETIQLLIKALKNAESQGRCEIMLTLQKIVVGLGSAGTSCYRDVYKATRNCMTDRSMNVRSAAAKCMFELVSEAPFVYTTDLDSLASLCFRALDGSNYDARCDVAKLLGHLLASSQSPKAVQATKGKQLKLEDALNLLATGFLRGGTGFLKSSTAGDMIKGGGTVNREVRVGVTHAYVEFGKAMGAVWLERNIPEFLDHVLGLVANPRATPTHVDAVYARKCVLFILRTLIGGTLGEKAQIAAAKEICQVIVRHMNAIDAVVESDKGSVPDTQMSQHVLVCALQELGHLVQSLGTSASPLVSEPSTGIIEPVVSVLLHPASSARLSAAWCLRSIAVALPSQMTILLERCMSRMHHLKSSPEAISGYSFALSALLGGVRETSLGIPHVKGRQIFNLAEELLRTATQTSRLSLQRTQSGWLLLGALMTLGPPVVRNHLPRMLLLWRNAFPRSTKELESEKARGDVFTWQVTLEGRAGALGAMHSFVENCPELVTEDVTRRLLPPLECALTMTAHLPSVVKIFGAHLKASAAMVRLRLYDVLYLLPPETYEGAFSALLRELVAEFTLTDNPANTTTSILRFMCHVDDSVILGSWLQETDHKAIEDQMEPSRKVDIEHLQPNSASGSGALEHDAASLFMKTPAGEPAPGPLPLGVAVIDSSVMLYGRVFPRVPHKHRYQMLEHFHECIKQAKSSRQQAVQINIFTAVLSSLKGLAETKTSIGNVEVRKASVNLVLGALGSSNPILRCAAGEALGRMAQVVGESKFIAEMAQYSFDKLKSARDVVTRTGHSLALGCLHRYVGGMGSGHHLGTSVSILLALAQDSTSPVVQVWALHALGLITDSGGPMFRGYVEPTLSLVLQLLLTVPQSMVDVHQCLGKCLAALITTIGPELQGNIGSIATARLSCLVCCAIMQDHYDSLVQAEAISCLQQLHLFAPRHVNLTTLVPHLCETLASPHLLLRRAAVSCLRQLAQREAREVSEHALSLALESKDKDKAGRPIMIETGLEGALFGLLDKETDRKLMSDVQDTLVSMLQTLAADNLTRWLALIKDVLQATTESSTLNSPVVEPTPKEEDDDSAGLQVNQPGVEAQRPLVAPRWPTRTFAIDCLLKIIAACEGNELHFDLARAKVKKEETKADFLVLHLSELVKMAFIAATSDSDKLRLAGLAALDEIINQFARVPEPEFPGHVILEQYQAQVGAALRPAFTPETAPDVTAAACEVCSCWIGSGVARDLNDLRRVHQLLVSSLAKLKEGKDMSPLYSESASTMEKLAVLRAWAEVYIVAMDQEKEKQVTQQKEKDAEDEDSEDCSDFSGGESLLHLVQPEMKTLSRHWLAALKDHALLSLPPEFSSQLPSDGGTFYTVDTMESSRPYYKKAWPPILYAASLWLKETGFTSVDKDSSRPANMKADESDADRFHLLLGNCVEALCSPTSFQTLETVLLCQKAIHTLLDDPWPRSRIGTDQTLATELLNVLHRLLLTRESYECFHLVVEIARQVVKAAQENVENERAVQREGQEQQPANAEQDATADPIPTQKPKKIQVIGEGGESGDIVPGKSLVFATLEVCLQVLVRELPKLNPNQSASSQVPAQAKREAGLTEEGCQLVSAAIQLMADLPPLCSPKGSVSLLPTILYLLIGVVRELAPSHCQQIPSAIATCLQSLKTLAISPFMQDLDCCSDWHRLLQSALATVINYVKPDASAEQPSIEQCTSLLTISVFLVSCPKEVVFVPNLLQPCVDIFKEAWFSKKPQVQLKCVQTLCSVFQHADRDVATPFIHEVGTPVVEHLLGAGGATQPVTDLELAVILEGVRMVETLVALAEDSTRINLITIIVPMLVSYLVEPTRLQEASAASRKLHEHALQRLMKFGPQYPTHFRTVMQASIHLRSRLEAAVKAQQASAKPQVQSDVQKKSDMGVSAKPTIQLKTNFSNFTG